MIRIKTYIGRLLSGILMLLPLLTGCTSPAEDVEVSNEKPVLKIEVLAPDHPTVSRADNGNVTATEAESAIHNIHLWVFEHDNGNFVGYANSSTGSEIATGQATFMMEVSNDFSDRKPNVDVYVMANVTKEDYSLGIDLDKNATRAQLDGILIGSDKFGVSSPVNSVPNGGLPMSGVLKNQEIVPPAPILGIGPNVKLIRAVSKVHFVFTSIEAGHTIESISLDGNMIPTTEYLFLTGAYSANGEAGYRYKVGDSYESSAAIFMNTQTPINPCNTDRGPAYYVYKDQTGQAYEDMIAEGLTVRTGQTTADLTGSGPYYLRESDKQITGTITYDTNKTATFSLASAGEFGRNHTWIVYGYFTETMDILTVNIKVKEWDPMPNLQHTVHNW